VAFPTSRVLENIGSLRSAALREAPKLGDSCHTQNLNNLKTLHRALGNAIAKEQEGNVETTRNWLSKDRKYFEIKERYVQAMTARSCMNNTIIDQLLGRHDQVARKVGKADVKNFGVQESRELYEGGVEKNRYSCRRLLKMWETTTPT
jgi:hypothetical protein